MTGGNPALGGETEVVGGDKQQSPTTEWQGQGCPVGRISAVHSRVWQRLTIPRGGRAAVALLLKFGDCEFTHDNCEL